MGGVLHASVEWTDAASAWSDMIMVGLTVATLIGVFLVFGQIRLQRKQLHRDLENLYVERYWTIMDRMEAADPGSQERERAVLAYLGLSEDQCDLRAQGRVTDETWTIWGSSINAALQMDEYASILEEQPADRFLQLRNMQVEGDKYDPSDLTPAQRKKIGL